MNNAIKGFPEKSRRKVRVSSWKVARIARGTRWSRVTFLQSPNRADEQLTGNCARIPAVALIPNNALITRVDRNAFVVAAFSETIRGAHGRRGMINRFRSAGARSRVATLPRCSKEFVKDGGNNQRSESRVPRKQRPCEIITHRPAGRKGRRERRQRTTPESEQPDDSSSAEQGVYYTPGQKMGRAV